MFWKVRIFCFSCQNVSPLPIHRAHRHSPNFWTEPGQLWYVVCNLEQKTQKMKCLRDSALLTRPLLATRKRTFLYQGGEVGRKATMTKTTAPMLKSSLLFRAAKKQRMPYWRTSSWCAKTPFYRAHSLFHCCCSDSSQRFRQVGK